MFALKSKLFAPLCIILITLVVSACGGDPGGEENAQAIAAGRQLYETGGASQVPCLTCHTLDGTELVGPSFQGLGERAGSRVSGLSAEDYIRQSITQPHVFLVPGYEATMPTVFGEVFTDEDIDNLIAFLLSQ